MYAIRTTIKEECKKSLHQGWTTIKLTISSALSTHQMGTELRDVDCRTLSCVHCTYAAAQPRNIVHPQLRIGHSSCVRTNHQRPRAWIIYNRLRIWLWVDASRKERRVMSSHGDLLVVEGWQQTSEARGYVNALLKRNKRKQPGRRVLCITIPSLTNIWAC